MITVGDNFNYQGKKPLDSRIQFASVADMKAYPEASLYNGCLAYITAVKKNYQYDSSNTVDTTTGRWREFETGGGGGTSDYNDLTNKPQIAGTTLSGNTSLATLGLTSNVETQSDGSSTKSYVSRGEKYDWNTGNTVYGACTTSASTTAKSVLLARGTLNFTVGAKVSVKFSYTNTASAPTLTINSTTKNIKYIDADGNVSTPLIWWNAGDIVEFTYDGTQWLMKPTMQMLFSGQSTKIPREQIYSTSEKIVGCWTDGRPVYQKTIDCGALPNATSKSVSHGISNILYIVSAEGWSRESSGVIIPLPFTSSSHTNDVEMYATTSVIHFATQVNTSAFNITYVTLQYTKTTDAANSFNYGDPNDYSTTEKIVGSWIDGKPLYQKTIAITTPTTSDNGVVANADFAIGSTVVSVAKFWGFFKKDGMYYNMFDGSPNSVEPATYMRLRILSNSWTTSSERNKIRITNTTPTWNACSGYVTVQYTKS